MKKFGCFLVKMVVILGFSVPVFADDEGAAPAQPAEAPQPTGTSQPEASQPALPVPAPAPVAPTAPTNSVTLLPNGDVGMAAMLQVIASAKRSIQFSYYVFDPSGTSTKLFIQALVKKAKAGVAVTGIIDAYDLASKNAQNLANLAKVFSDARIKFKYYNPNTIANGGPGQNYRSHIKLLVADQLQAVVGSRNIGDEHFALRKEFDYTDRDLLIVGPAARQVSASFNELWNGKWSIAYSAPQSYDQAWLKSVFAYTAREKAALDYFNTTGAEQLAQLPVRSCSDVKFVSDYPDFTQLFNASEQIDSFGMSATERAYKRTTTAYLWFLRETQSSLRIENWAYAPAPDESAEFQILRTRKVPVEVITNVNAYAGGQFDQSFDQSIAAAAKSDTVPPETVMQISHQGSFTQANKLTPVHAPWAIHQKIAIRDSDTPNAAILVGSFNLDRRSYGLNLEDAAIIKNCPLLNADLLGQYQLLKNTYSSDLKSCSKCIATQDPNLLDIIKLHLIQGWL